MRQRETRSGFVDELDLHQWAPGEPVFDGWRIAVHRDVRAIETGDDLGEDSAAQFRVHDRHRRRRQVGEDSVFEVQREVGVGQQVGIPVTTAGTAGEVELPARAVESQISWRRGRPVRAPVVVMSIRRSATVESRSMARAVRTASSTTILLLGLPGPGTAKSGEDVRGVPTPGVRVRLAGGVDDAA
jgi:hypothetical protein